MPKTARSCSASKFAQLCSGVLFRVLLVLVILSGVSHGQEITGDLAGTIQDKTGAAIPNATVTATNLGNAAQRTVNSGGSGEFVFSHLPLGTYRVEVKGSGFETFVVPEVKIEADSHLRLNPTLAIGAATDVVEVSAEQAGLQTEGGGVNSNISEKALEDLPTNGRNFVNLVTVEAGVNSGVSNSVSSGGRPDDRRMSSTVSANGQGDIYNNFVLDGTDNNDRYQGLIGVRPSIEALREVNISTNTYDPELGRTSGAVISMLTKSGTNTIHGSVYEYIRNNVTDAKDFFATTIRKPTLQQNQFGGSVGGPIWRGRTFFFGDYEGLRKVDGSTNVSLATVPTLYEENHPGDFSDVKGGVVLPAASIDPTSLLYYKLFPAPNTVGLVDANGVPSQNYLSDPSTSSTLNTFDVRVDHSFTPNNLLFARFSYNGVLTTVPSPFPEVNGVYAGGTYAGNFAGPSKENSDNAQLDYTHIFSQNLLLELRAGYTRLTINSLPQNYGSNLNDTAFPIPGANRGLDDSGLAPILINGYGALGNAIDLPIIYTGNTFQYNGGLTWTLGRHTFKAGAALIRRQVSDFQNFQGQGIFEFVLGTTYFPTTPDSLTANMQNFLTGRNFIAVRRNLLQTQSFRMWEPSTFVQDTWRQSEKLTVTYGVRYDVFTAPVGTSSDISNLNLSTSQLMIGGNAGVQTQYGNVAPRVGFSEAITTKTVIRGGFGLSFFPTDQNNAIAMNNPPYGYATGSVFFGSTPISAGIPAPPAATSTTALSGQLSTKPQNYRTGMMEQYNVFVEHDFAKNVVSLGYIGELGRHLALNIGNIDVAAPNGTKTYGPTPYASTLPNVNTIKLYGDQGASSYNAMQVKFEREYSHGLRFQANYTLAHGLDNTTAIGPAPTEGAGLLPNNLNYDYGNSTLDVRHRVAVTGNYELPFVRQAKGIKKEVFGGWQVNGVGYWQTNTPFTVVSNTQHIYTSSTITSDRPNMVGNPNGGSRGLSQFFNIADFQAQAIGTPGSEARNQLYGPHLRRVDLSLFKTFDIVRNLKFQFRAEAYNISNTPNFGLPTAAISSYTASGVATSSGGFGSISKTNPNVGARQFQFAAKLLF
jgi:hypothetical protein